MKIFKVEFTMFCGVEWNIVDYEIIASSMAELEDAVMDELQWMSEEITEKQKWNIIKKNIVEDYFKFPIIIKNRRVM